MLHSDSVISSRDGKAWAPSPARCFAADAMHAIPSSPMASLRDRSMDANDAEEANAR